MMITFEIKQHDMWNFVTLPSLAHMEGFFGPETTIRNLKIWGNDED
jgi:hypothetical protein